ncbi:hypothetical protein D9758_014756 [Tetrapyrgos nigripes]|uniref:Uncharacterized protein n=1 Tax=Tetrapyrgos nigripes TaxID=182062 RepID=A0A8H5FLC5_9AGAR|nr:hypothetical protein D9758_014756 [Tetrapyrgos nigripes]
MSWTLRGLVGWQDWYCSVWMRDTDFSFNIKLSSDRTLDKLAKTTLQSSNNPMNYASLVPSFLEFWTIPHLVVEGMTKLLQTFISSSYLIISLPTPRLIGTVGGSLNVKLSDNQRAPWTN